MSPFKDVVGKLGNMRKAVQWSVYPSRKDGQPVAIIQCDRRIAAVNLENGTAVLSDGKGHPGFIKLSEALGATKCICPDDLLEQLRALRRRSA